MYSEVQKIRILGFLNTLFFDSSRSLSQNRNFWKILRFLKYFLEYAMQVCKKPLIRKKQYNLFQHLHAFWAAHVKGNNKIRKQ